MKMMIIVILLWCSACFSWILLTVSNLIPFNFTHLFVATVGGGTFVTGLLTLYVEYLIEVTYPLSAEILSGIQIWWLNLIIAIFMGVFSIEDVGYAWIDHVLLWSTVIGIPLVMLTKEEYKRSNLDASRIE